MFDGCFFRFIAAFSDPALGPLEKAEQLQRAIRDLPPSEAPKWEEFMKLINENVGGSAKGAADFAGASSGAIGQGPGGAGDYCQCDACPWRQKVLNMDLIFGIDGKGML